MTPAREAALRTGLLALLAGANIVLGFLYSGYVVTRLSSGHGTDALFAGMAVPQLVLAVVSGSLTFVLVPLLATTTDAGRQARAAWTFFAAVTLAFSALALLLFATAPGWVPLTVPGFGAATRRLTVALTRIQMLDMLFTAQAAVLASVFYARGRFVRVEAGAAAANLAGLVFLALALPRLGVAAASWAIVLKDGLQVALLLPGIGRPSRPDWRSELVRTAWRRLRPLMLGTVYTRTDLMVNRYLASRTPAGDLSLLFLAMQIFGAASQVLIKAVVAPVTPQLAQRADSGDWAGFERLAWQRIWAVLGLSALGYGVLAAAGRPALMLLFGQGRMGAPEVHRLWLVLTALGGVWVAGNAGQAISAAFYARGDTRFLAQLNAWTYTLYTPIKILAAVRYGIFGIAVSYSLATILGLVWPWVVLKRGGRARDTVARRGRAPILTFSKEAKTKA